MRKISRLNSYYALSAILTTLLIGVLFKNTESAQKIIRPPEVHISKTLSVYSVSMFNDMLQEYCSSMDLKADYHGGLNPVLKRGGNKPVYNPDENVSWTILPKKSGIRPEMSIAEKVRHSRFNKDDWFTICLTVESNGIEGTHINLRSQRAMIKLPKTYGKYMRLTAKLPNKMTVREFLLGLSEYSNSYKTMVEKTDQIFNRVDKPSE